MIRGKAATIPLQDEFGSIAKFLDLLLGVSTLSVFAEGLYRPLKRLGAGLFANDPSTWTGFQETVAPLLPAIILIGALWQGRQLFHHLASGDVLTVETATGVRRTGEWIVGAAIVGLIVGEAVVGARAGWAFLGGLAAIGLTLRSLASIFDHAVAIKADHDQIV